MTELSQIVPNSKKVKISTGVEYTIQPFKLGQMPAVLAEVNPIYKKITEIMVSGKSQLEVFTELIEQCGDPIINLICIGYKLPRETVDQFDLDDAIELISALVEVNADFFTRKVLPTLTKTMGTLRTQTGVK